MAIRLDILGGMAGDMFIAAMLHALPHLESRVLHAIAAACGPDSVSCGLTAHADAVLTGRRFDVALHGAVPLLQNRTAHAHTSWAAIRLRLMEADLLPGVRQHALQIFALLAEAEATVHGVDVDDVEFHEVGAWDSIADITAAAAIIEAVGREGWSHSPVPLGAGRIRTAHGVMTVPAPATARLLLGMETIDDGIGGERVTPTGAAILRYLCPPGSTARAGAQRLVASGTGFGTRTLPGISNHLRALCFETMEQQSGGGHRTVHVLEFEVDDQSGEDLAAGLDRVRAHAGVLDVTQCAVFGKKNRMMVHVRVLLREAALEQGIEACFRETTTIGLRHRAVQGIGLPRTLQEVEVDGRRVRVKVVDRPGGHTAKAEADDVARLQDHAHRLATRRKAEEQALRQAESNA